jgi:shikimate dehydrogenase
MSSMTAPRQSETTVAESTDPLVRKHRPEAAAATTPERTAPVPEIGGRKDGTDPTRFGDWEKNGRCIDF